MWISRWSRWIILWNQAHILEVYQGKLIENFNLVYVVINLSIINLIFFFDMLDLKVALHFQEIFPDIEANYPFKMHYLMMGSLL